MDDDRQAPSEGGLERDAPEGGERGGEDLSVPGSGAPEDAAGLGEPDTEEFPGAAAPQDEKAVSQGDEMPDRIRELEAEFNRMKERHLRLAADFDNYRKRMEIQLRERWDRAQADLLARMLDPLDDLLRVTELEPDNASVDAIVEGVDLVERKFFQAMSAAGLEVVATEGEAFDPNTMEAMMRVPADSDELDDQVDKVFQRGYTFRGMLVRAARVSVFKA